MTPNHELQRTNPVVTGCAQPPNRPAASKLGVVSLHSRSMKLLSFVILYIAAFALPAKAEMQFPPYESLSPKEKAAWGYTVEKFVGHNYHNAMFRLVIPPK